MRALAICLALLALSLPEARALEVQILTPPKEYVRPPDVPYSVTVVTQERINQICKYDAAVAALRRAAYNDGSRVAGCAKLDTNEVFVVDNVRGQLLRDVIEHELAHINGWRH